MIVAEHARALKLTPACPINWLTHCISNMSVLAVDVRTEAPNPPSSVPTSCAMVRVCSHLRKPCKPLQAVLPNLTTCDLLLLAKAQSDRLYRATPQLILLEAGAQAVQQHALL